MKNKIKPNLEREPEYLATYSDVRTSLSCIENGSFVVYKDGVWIDDVTGVNNKYIIGICIPRTIPVDEVEELRCDMESVYHFILGDKNLVKTLKEKLDMRKQQSGCYFSCNNVDLSSNNATIYFPKGLDKVLLEVVSPVNETSCSLLFAQQMMENWNHTVLTGGAIK